MYIEFLGCCFGFSSEDVWVRGRCSDGKRNGVGGIVRKRCEGEGGIW